LYFGKWYIRDFWYRSVGNIGYKWTSRNLWDKCRYCWNIRNVRGRIKWVEWNFWNRCSRN